MFNVPIMMVAKTIRRKTMKKCVVVIVITHKFMTLSHSHKHTT